MRRGHSGIGGWRNENQRHFRPRTGGNPRHRPSRNFGFLDSPRFLPPFEDARPRFKIHSKSDRPSDHPERYRYRDYNAYQRPHQRPQIPSFLNWNRPNDNRNTSQESSNYYEDDNDQQNHNFHINNMKDVDHRQIPQSRDYSRPPPPIISQWQKGHHLYNSPVKDHNICRQDGSYPNKPTVASAEYTGHRPPASDHYGSTTSVIDNSNTFSRSVDDTVDIIRKRLQSRSDPQNTANTDFGDCQDKTASNDQNLETSNNFQHEPPIRKQYQKQHVTNKTNCVKIKNKIVNQLFKMDKEKIHKLMDNPNSSSKFEYAISSLITESQNSFNKHLRSAAEKSLCGSSTEFIENENNTIYEDTFIKQMKCMLDPQDTLFLEDIKPFVMAEITKVLQLDEYEENYYNMGQDHASDNHHVHQNYYQYPSENITKHEDFPAEDNYSMENAISEQDYQRPKSVEANISTYGRRERVSLSDSKPIFERRQRTQSFSYMQDSSFSGSPYYRRESEERHNEDKNRSKLPNDLFDSNAEQFSEEEDPFEELDKQYHVAVDPDFIEGDDISNAKQEKNVYNTNDYMFKSEPLSPEKNIGENIDAQLHDMAKSPLKLTVSGKFFVKEETKETLTQYKQEPSLSFNNTLPLQEKNGNNTSCDNENTNRKYETESKEITNETRKTDISSNLKSTSSSNSRKRSIDQRPAHRKEKRKKSESSASEPSKQILNKNIIINVNDCASKSSDKCETPKSIFNLFFSKDNSNSVLKDKAINLDDKNCSEKHVKRKEILKKTPDKDSKPKRKDSTSSRHIISPTENNNTSITGETSIKLETKTSLKPIDMFIELPKKPNIHQAHRNTAPIQAVTPKTEIINKTKNLKGPLCKQLVKKHVGVQVIRKLHSKQTQTPPSRCGTQFCLAKKKHATRSVQTECSSPDKTDSSSKSTNAFERMKEIDLEIQVLLQEKFKLYSSIENKDSGSSSMQTLGMTVLNVSPYNGQGDTAASNEILCEDAIVRDFANIPVEELEQIAMETVQEHEKEKSKQSKRTRRNKAPFQCYSTSPVTVQKRKINKRKSPNISLIEQIIEDDRPLEDIIELEELEIPEIKAKSKNKKAKSSKSYKNRIHNIHKNKTTQITNTVGPTIKECSVVLKRINITPYLKPIRLETPELVTECTVSVRESNNINHKGIVLDSNPIIYESDGDIVEETVVNDIHFDMLDVSEDIVVGDNCVKDEVVETVPICEEIILDNSQSSVDEMTTPAGGQNTECKMFDYSADENLCRDSILVNGNADAVLALECVENNFLAASLDGNVYYFNSDGQLLTTLRGSNLAVTCLTIVKEKYGTTIYTGSLDSRIRYYDLESGLEKGPECNVLSPIQTMDRAWDTVFVGTRTGFVLQFECKNNMLIPVSSVKFSDQSILALRAMKEGPRKVLLVAARSEMVTIKDAQTGLLLRTLQGPKMTVYSLLYEDGKVYCGTSNQQIHVFDYVSGSHCGTHSGGKGCVCLRAGGGLVFAGCYDGCVYVYREGEEQPLAQLRGPSLMLLSLAVMGTKIIAGYKDRSLYIWKIPLCILQEMIL